MQPTMELLPFHATLAAHGLTLTRRRLTTLQVNVGRKCNQACHHCHVEAGPNRTEMMARATLERLVALVAAAPAVTTVDVTGGAPELHPDFRWFVAALRGLGKRVIDRCNLTVLLEPGQEDTAAFLAAQGVEITASLPCYTKENVEKQRGKAVFDKSIEALRRLNALGYGKPGSGLVLNLVYNPGGAFLPGPQPKLEADYKRELGEHFGVEFNALFTMTNMPIKRFLHELERDGKREAYQQLLVERFNPQAAEGVMCRDLVSVAYDGTIYDCDFNQMLDLPAAAAPKSVADLRALADLDATPIAAADHCYGCTAGAGSSCGGALA